MATYSLTVFDAAGTDLPASVETDLLGANGVDVSQVDSLVIDVENLNVSNVIDGLKIYEKAPGGSKWNLVSVSLASVAASLGSTIKIDDHAHGRIRLTSTPTNHVSADVHARGLRKDF